MTNEKLNNLTIANEELAAGNDQQPEVTPVETDVLGMLFVDESNPSVATGAHLLNKTARLTQTASEIADAIFKAVTADIETYGAQIQASQKSHDAMDDLINEQVNLGAVDVDYLKTQSEDELEKMIRSQQSKRSRAKSKVMTKENYLTMMTGAIAENLLRLVSNKPKSSGSGAVMGDIGYSAEDIEKFAEFPEDLKKEIRNVQSKKSIMKAKQGFDIMSPRYQQLLRAEQQLKDVRDRVNGVASTQAQEALEVKKQAEEMLADVDPNNMSADDAKALLEAMKEMLANK